MVEMSLGMNRSSRMGFTKLNVSIHRKPMLLVVVIRSFDDVGCLINCRIYRKWWNLKVIPLKVQVIVHLTTTKLIQYAPKWVVILLASHNLTEPVRHMWTRRPGNSDPAV